MTGKQQSPQLPSLVLGMLAAVYCGLLLGQGSSEKPGDDATVLEPIQVTPQINPLDESMQRLRKMMEDPGCRNCGPLLEADRENDFLKIAKALSVLTGADFEPPNPDYVQRQEYRVQNDWRHAERGPDMDDFR